MSYDAFAITFSNSRKNHPWPELDAIIEDMRKNEYTSVLDIGCGNGRFLTEVENGGLKIENYRGIDASSGMIDEARKIHPDSQFEVISMESMTNELGSSTYDALLFLASFHHIHSSADRLQVLLNTRKFLTPNGRIYMTNWNLCDQEKYNTSKTSEGEYQIKIGAYNRYYHGFTLGELSSLFVEAGFVIEEHRIFEGGRNIFSIIA